MRARHLMLLACVLSLVCVAPTLAWAREPIVPRESPLYGAPYRRGLEAELAVGVAICQPSPLYRSFCGPLDGGGPALPGVGLRLGLGWRFNPNWQLSGAWIRQGHRPGGSFSQASSDGVMLAGRGIVPLPTVTGADSKVDLGFELGLGWSQRTLNRDEAPFVMRSNGAVIRPALILEGWVLADLAIGLELATQLNFHWQHCADDRCEAAPGDWIGSELDRRFVDGFTIAVRMSGLLYPHL